MQVVFDASTINPILVCDADGNVFVFSAYWSEAPQSATVANVAWLNNANTIQNVFYATFDSVYKRIKIVYKNSVAAGGFFSVDGRVRFKWQNFTQT